MLENVPLQLTTKIKYKGKIASLLEVGTGFHNELTGRENIFLNGAIYGMNKKEAFYRGTLCQKELIYFFSTEKMSFCSIERDP